MSKYEIKTVLDYIKGEEICGFELEDLENDKRFMMLVISASNDKNFYNLCSDNIKKDYEFVKFMISKFSNDLSFICKVADYFLEVVEDELQRTELIAIMTELIKDNKKYQVIKDAILTSKRVQVEIFKAETDDALIVKEVGMGFWFILTEFNSSKIVLDFYAKYFIDVIFAEYDIDLESMLHNQFTSPEQINKLGINNYILNFIEVYDHALAAYLSTNIDLLSDLSKRIKEVQKNWKKFEFKNERTKYTLIINKVHEYMEQVGDKSVLSESYLLYYIGKKLGILDKIVQYDLLDSEVKNDIINDLDDDFVKSTLKESFQENVYYNNVMRIISSIAFSNRYKDPDSDFDPDNKGKVLKVDFQNK